MRQKAPDIDHLETWIGREEVTSERLTESLVAKYRATFDMDAVGDLAPRLIHFCLSPAVAPTSALGADGHPRRGGFLPPVPLPRRMWAGGSLSFTGDLYIGDEVRRTSRIADIAMKSGRSGELCFVKVEHTVSVGGAVRVQETQDIVYRGLDAGGAPREAPEAAPAGDARARVVPDPALLFRYSALTFNAHRIHYDRGYVTDEEGYPGLVVHGPLQAALLLNLAEKTAGKPPSSFQFRSLSPLFDTEEFFLNATWEGETLKLWTSRGFGPVAMRGEARFL